MKKSLVGSILITFFITLSLFSASTLWLTRKADLPSQSMFFDQPNVVWYILMHVGITMSFFILNSIFSKRVLYGLVAFSSICTAGIDLLLSTFWHNVSTLSLFVFACISMIYYGPKPYRPLYIIMCSIASISFGSGVAGWIGESGIFLGEYIAEICVSFCVLHQIWIAKQ